MFLLVPAHPGFPGQIPQSRKTVVCVCVVNSTKRVTLQLTLLLLLLLLRVLPFYNPWFGTTCMSCCNLPYYSLGPGQFISQVTLTLSLTLGVYCGQCVHQYQKKHSPTHTYPDHQSSFICFLHLLRSMASSVFSLHA